MKIRIKVKHLILILALSLIGYQWILPQANLAFAKYLDGRDSPRAHAFYERYLRMDDSLAAKMQYADSMIPSFGKFTIYQQGWGGGDSTSLDVYDRVEKVLWEGLEEIPTARNESIYIDAYTKLMDISIARGDASQLLGLIDFGQTREREILLDRSEIYEAYLLFANRDYSGALVVIEQLQARGVDDGRIKVLEAEINIALGNIEEAKEQYKDLWSSQRMVFYKEYFGSGSYNYRNYWLDEYCELITGENRIRGRVMFEDQPMAFVEVYFLSAGGGVRIGGEGFIAITDQDGYFETLGLRDGLYDIGLGLDGSLLTDKVFQKSNKGYVELPRDEDEIEYTFRKTLRISSPRPGEVIDQDQFMVSWEPVEGAEYYTVEPVVFSNPMEMSGGSFRRPIEDVRGEQRFKETRATFLLSDYRNYTGGLTFSGEDWVIGSNAILGIFIPGAEYPIVVNAYDSDESLITSSLPLRTYYEDIPTIVIPGSLSKGQILVAETRYPEAIEYYENQLLEAPDDQEAIASLVKIYGIGWKRGEKNLERSFQLLEKLDNEKLKGDLLNSILFEMDNKELVLFQDSVQSGIDLLNALRAEDGTYLEYRFHMAREDYRAARDALERLDNHIPDSLPFLHIYFGDYDLAVERLQDERFYPSRLQGKTFKAAILGLSENPPGEDEMELLREFLIRMIQRGAYEERREIQERVTRQVEDVNILTIVDEIYNDRHWNH